MIQPMIQRLTTRRTAPTRSVWMGLLALCLSLAGIAPAGAQTPPDADTPTIEVLPMGSFHFRRAPSSNDPMAPEQQAEIQAVGDSLAHFRSTKVAIERVVEDTARIDSLYQAYRAGRHELGVSEAFQLGFRVAKRRGHDQVYPIDYKLAWPMDTVRTWAKQHQPSFLRYYENWRKRMGAIMDSLHATASIGEILRHLNSDALLSRIQAARMRTLEVGAGTSYVGVEPPASIARRNMRIFANLLAMAEPGDRILIVYGVGHSHYFREYVRGHPDMTLVQPREYL
jgi:hypothetical protein